ncbi:hypothetical protein C0W35_06795 [Photobacterium kishitanii]|uniref:hypothetical protein n=1 Tax=Photobacterium kishitanii TaxID=318456 RepID=UPI000D17E355|nr:hypothetical protein [Photobacterium kishitanii]PSU95294.1 hypothetical protein C0W35_06795 [Photobacterium kishitanii]
MINKFVGHIISLSNINYFSAVEIRTAYIAIKRNEQLDASEVRRFVYEELLKLVNKGWLRTRKSKKKSITRYIKTDLFDRDYFLNPLEFDCGATANKTIPCDIQQTFTMRINQYNSELLEGLGAIKEYDALKEINPKLHASFKQRYLSLEENNHILKGKITALNEFIASDK